jgi:hypothetical protein
MSKTTACVLVLTGEEIVAAAMLDPIKFVEERAAAMDEAAQVQAMNDGRFAVTHGSTWGLLLPDDHDVTSIAETYDDDLAAMVAEQAQHAPPWSVVAWKVFETIPRGQG